MKELKKGTLLNVFVSLFILGVGGHTVNKTEVISGCHKADILMRDTDIE